jgi:excisionase family DNA binding protein
MNEFVTTQEAAEELGITDSRVRQLIIEGKLPAKKFGKSHMIKRNDLKGVIIGKRGRPRKDTSITEQLKNKKNQRKKG